MSQQSLPNELPGLDWATIDFEQFRGEGLSFPTHVQIVISPTFNLFTLGTARNFCRYFTGSFLDPEGEGFEVLMKAEVSSNDDTALLGPGDFCLILTYISGEEVILILNPTPTMH